MESIGGKRDKELHFVHAVAYGPQRAAGAGARGAGGAPIEPTVKYMVKFMYTMYTSVTSQAFQLFARGLEASCFEM